MDKLHSVKVENSQLVVEIRRWQGLLRLIDQSKNQAKYDFDVAHFLNRTIEVLSSQDAVLFDQYVEPNGETHVVRIPKEVSEQQSILSVLVDPMFGFRDGGLSFNSYSQSQELQQKWRAEVSRIFYRAQTGSFPHGYQRKRFTIRSVESLESLVKHSIKEADRVGHVDEKGENRLYFDIFGNSFRVYNDPRDDYSIISVEVRVHDSKTGSDAFFQFTDSYRPFSFQTLKENFEHLTASKKYAKTRFQQRPRL